MDSLTVAAVAGKVSPVLSTLSGGIGYEMFFWAFVGSIIHACYKWINAINDSQLKKEPFYFINWLSTSAPMMIFSILCGLAFVFGISQWWNPVTITKSIIAGLLAGSAVFNILPVATNPDMWKSIGTWLVDKFKPKS